MESNPIDRVREATVARDQHTAEWIGAIKDACAAGYTVREVAEAAAISPSYVSRLVSGQRGARRERGSEGTD